MAKSKKNLTQLSNATLPSEKIKKTKKKKKKKTKSKSHKVGASAEEQRDSQVSSSSESGESSRAATVVRSAAAPANNVAIAIPQLSSPSNPSILNHIQLLILNNWRSLSVCSRITTFILPYICMLLYFGWTLLFKVTPRSYQYTQDSSRSSPPADLTSPASMKRLHVYPDSNFTRTFTQDLLTVWADGSHLERHPLEFIFYSTLEALMNKLKSADVEELAIQLPDDWDGARPLDYMIIPSPRINLRNEKERTNKKVCSNEESACSSFQTYLKSGLLAVQRSVDLTALGWRGSSERRANLAHDGFHVRIREMDEGRRFHEYERFFVDPIYLMAILLSMIPFIELYYKLMVQVVHEKGGVKNLLKMMGISETAYWVSKFLYYGIFVVYYAIVITASLKLLLFRETTTSIVFVLLLLFGISCLALAYLLSAFFPSPKYTFIAYVAIYVVIIFDVVRTVAVELPPTICLNTMERKYFVLNINAALASLYASFLPDRAYDELRRRYPLPLDWHDIKPHANANGTVAIVNTFSRELNEDRVFYGMIFFSIDTLAYLLLREQSLVLPCARYVTDPFGIRQSPIFLCLPSYWGLSPKTKISAAPISSTTTVTDENFEPVPPGMFGAPAISIRNLTKNYTFCPWRRIPDALKGISLDIYAGQVTGILGKNGAGKSTLFHILIGLIPPTAGTTNIFGYNSSNPADLVKIRRMVGVCLQHEVHFHFLTVLEHLQFFGKLRGLQGMQLSQEVVQLIRDLNLEDVKYNRANQLSGGQKRRLSVGLAFVGNPPIIFLDEPSAGLDPVARRGLWSLLQSRREGKVILLTTHFMDEADILADRKAIMNAGIVRCMGSSLFLKNRLGAGYQLTLELTSASVDTRGIDQIITQFCPDASNSRKQIAHELKYSIPFSEASKFSSMFAQLELEIGKSIKNLGISTTSLEDVFLRVCNDEVISLVERSHMDEQVDLLGDLGLLKISFLLSLWTMVLLRLRRLFRSPCYFAMLFIIPLLLTVAFSTINLEDRRRLGYSSHARISLKISERQGSYKDSKVGVHDNGDDAAAIAQFLKNQGISVETYVGEPEDWRKLAEPDKYMAALGVQMSGNGSLVGDVWVNDRVPHASPILLDLLFKFYAESLGERGSGRRVVVNTEYDILSRRAGAKREATGVEKTVWLLIPFVLGLTYSAPLAELVYDNEKQLRNHLRVSGLAPLIYYLSVFIVYFSLTFLEYLLLAASNWIFNLLPLANPHASLVIFVLTILSITESMLLMFLLSLLMRKTTLAYALFFPLYLVLIIVPAVVLVVLEALYPDAEQVRFYAVCALDTFYIPFGFYDGVVSEWEKLYEDEPVTFSAYNVYKVTGPLIISIVHILCYLGLLILIHLGCVQKAYFQFCSLFKSAWPRLNPQQVDEDVLAEGQRIDEIFPSVAKNSDCVLIAKQLRKSYGRTQILRGLSLLVEKGQVLGLLGHNGAGKTTTMRIITAEEPADSGQVKLGGYKIPEQAGLAFRELGFCPQHDALWENIRVNEHMNLYSVIHGVPGSRRSLLAHRILDGLSIREHERKYSQNLSGGTKRKLSYAIAMASAPQIVLMDEPSTGMDPQSKRFLWNTVLGSFKENRGAILTTHAMEEADVLSSKIVIMAKGSLLCVGSPQHLKSKFGRSYTLEVKLESLAEASTNVEGVQSSVQFEFVFKHFPNCNLVEQFGNRAVFSIPVEGLRPLSETFALLEKLKASHGIQEYAYTQTTLEQVYLTIDQAAHKNVLQ